MVLLFADFISKLLVSLNEKNCRSLCDNLFGLLEYTDMVAKHRAFNDKARIFAIMLENDCSKERKILLECFEAMHNMFCLFDIRYKKDTKEFDYKDFLNKIRHPLFGLSPGETNKIFKKIFPSKKGEDIIFYWLKDEQLIVKYYNTNEKKFEKNVFLLTESKKKCVHIKSYKSSCRLKGITRIARITESKGYTEALRIHEIIIEGIKAVGLQKEECCWCNPIRKTKHKCSNCRKITKAYKEFQKLCPELPKNLNQIICRFKKCTGELKHDEYIQEVREKLNQTLKKRLTDEHKEAIRKEEDFIEKHSKFKSLIQASFEKKEIES